MKEIREIIPAKANEPVLDLERPFEPHLMPGTGRYPAYRDVYGQEGFNVLDYWRAIRKRIWLVVGIAVLVTTLVAIYMARKPDIFSAAAVVQVDLEQSNPDLVTTDSKRVISNQDPSYFNTQLQLLNSDTLLRRVVKEHSLDANKDFQEARNARGTSAFRSMLKAIGLASDNSANKSDSNAAAENQENSSLISAEDIADAVRLAPYVDLVKLDLGIEPVRESRATIKDTRLIEISYRNKDPEFAAFVANAIGETFASANQEKRSGTSRKTSDFLTKRINDLQTDIRGAETELVELKQTEGILKTDGDQTIVLDRLSGLNKNLLEAENKRKTAEAKYFAIKDSPDSIKALAEAESARYITERENNLEVVRNQTQAKINEFQADRDQKGKIFLDKAPEMIELDTKINSLRETLNKLVERTNDDIKSFRERTGKVLVDNLGTSYLQARDEEAKIRAAYNVQYAEAQGQNAGTVKIKMLEQTIETNRGFLDNLRKQQSGNDVVSQGSDNNISVASFAIPSQAPVGPRRLMTVAVALMLSTLFGMGLALFLEYLDDTINTTEEVENYLQLPALAAIPTIDSIPKRKLLLVGGKNDEAANDPMESELLIFADPRSSLSESYRQLRTSILLSTAGHAPKSLLITSSLPSEGKTTTATNTAISLAQTGAKVLIIDADMRRPRLHSVFNVNNREGLSTVLSSELSREQIMGIVNYDERTKVSVLTSGPIPPNPAELVGSQQMVRLLKTLQDEFTHVVIDSPPITSFTDGVLVASLVDGVILVVHSGKSSRQVVRRARQLLLDVRAKVLGVVLNNVNLNSQGNYYYYQSYYYRNNYRHSDQQE
ncbi:MAG: GumC family protein [Pyrinomonadaceae bacterium]